MTKKTLIILAGLALVLAAPFASALSAATKITQIMQQLEAKSAKIVPMSKLPKALADKPRTKHYDCDSVACWCSGGSDCLADRQALTAEPPHPKCATSPSDRLAPCRHWQRA